jgi:hypothetical protein
MRLVLGGAGQHLLTSEPALGTRLVAASERHALSGPSGLGGNTPWRVHDPAGPGTTDNTGACCAGDRRTLQPAALQPHPPPQKR